MNAQLRVADAGGVAYVAAAKTEIGAQDIEGGCLLADEGFHQMQHAARLRR